jgi:glutamyl-Q tRNA(Asp) synthetase
VHRLQDHPGNQGKTNGLTALLTVGRFAPSPTGPLHFGSLVAATASYLAARQAGGKWLLRIEDIDKPREQPGATASIIRILSEFGFVWDDGILYQSQRIPAYQEALVALHPYTYPCSCSRKDLQTHAQSGEFGLIYPGTCRNETLIPGDGQHAIRLRTEDTPICCNDLVQGNYCQRLASELGDFIIRRADGLLAYQLAVVVDDAFQGVNQIVRGADLLDNTPRQLWLQQCLGFPTPVYAHIPLAIGADGQKLSKQNLAPAINTEKRLDTLVSALRFLGQTCPPASEFDTLDAFWDWAIAHWDMQQVPQVHSLPHHTQDFHA